MSRTTPEENPGRTRGEVSSPWRQEGTMAQRPSRDRAVVSLARLLGRKASRPSLEPPDLTKPLTT